MGNPGIPLQKTNLTNVPLPSQKGVWGVCPGDGLIATVIRHATASWAGHAVMYVGGGMIVQATWPKVVYATAPTQNILWATGQQLTDDERSSVVAKADSLVGSEYDIWVYPFLAFAAVDAAITKNVSHLFDQDHCWDCSGLVAECDQAAGVSMFPVDLSTHFVTPAMLMNLGTQNGWFQGQ